MTDDDWVRQALEDAVDDVEPGHALTRIQARTQKRPPGRSWAWGLAGAAAGVAATITAVAWLDTPGAGPDGGIAVPPTPTRVETIPLPVYFVGETAGRYVLFPETVQVEPPHDVVRQAVDAALSGPSADPDYRAPFADLGATADRVDLVSGTIQLSLRGDPEALASRPRGMSQGEAAAAVEQLIYTVQDALATASGQPGSHQATPVQFLVDGNPAYSLLGVATQEPLAAAPRLDTIAPVAITEPADGATVPNGFTVKGEAHHLFEATYTWQLTQGETLVEEGFGTLPGAFDEFTEFTFDLPQVPPGRYTLVVQGSDPSGGEGNGPPQDDKQITIK